MEENTAFFMTFFLWGTSVLRSIRVGDVVDLRDDGCADEL